MTTAAIVQTIPNTSQSHQSFDSDSIACLSSLLSGLGKLGISLPSFVVCGASRAQAYVQGRSDRGRGRDAGALGGEHLARGAFARLDRAVEVAHPAGGGLGAGPVDAA